MCAKLYMVIPCYNEEDVLPITMKLFASPIMKRTCFECVSFRRSSRSSSNRSTSSSSALLIG